MVLFSVYFCFGVYWRFQCAGFCVLVCWFDWVVEFVCLFRYVWFLFDEFDLGLILFGVYLLALLALLVNLLVFLIDFGDLSLCIALILFVLLSLFECVVYMFNLGLDLSLLFSCFDCFISLVVLIDVKAICWFG